MLLISINVQYIIDILHSFSDRDLTALNYIIPPSSDTPYDMCHIIKAVVDEEEFFQIMPDYAKNIIVGFARLNGQTVGVVGNQPNQKAGELSLVVIDQSDCLILVHK